MTCSAIHVVRRVGQDIPWCIGGVALGRGRWPISSDAILHGKFDTQLPMPACAAAPDVADAAAGVFIECPAHVHVCSVYGFML